MAYHPSAFCDRRRRVAAFFVSIGLAVSSLVVPWVTSTAHASTPVVTNYTGTGISEPLRIAAGPDGALWFTNRTNNSIGRITTGGVVTNYTGTGISYPDGITAGPDGALWFTNAGSNGGGGGTPSIGRITTGGVVTNYTDPSINTPAGITAGPDGALWFTNEGNATIGRITTGGLVTNYTGTSISEPEEIAAGPDGALWFTSRANNSIGRITTGGVVTNYTDPSISQPQGITAGPDGALWFTNAESGTIGRITTGGVVTNYTGTGFFAPTGIAAGPDGALWFTNAGNTSIGRITTAGVVTNYTDPSIKTPEGITAGPDGALWFTNGGGDSIGRITTGSNPPPSTSVLIPSNGATLSGSTYLDASASNATSVEFRLFGGIYGYNAPVICTATPTIYGWLCNWNTTTVPNGTYLLASEAFNSAGTAFSSGVSVTVSNPPTTSVVVPSNGATLSGSTWLDASASNATSVEFRLFGGIYGYNAPVICTATPTIYGWLCNWNTTTVPNGTYLLASEAFNSAGTAFSSGVSVTVNNPVTVSFAGSTVFTYPSESVGVTLSQSSSNTVQVDFTSAAGPAAQLYWGAWVGAASSFSPSSGTVTFAPGQTTATIPLTVNPTTVTGCDTTTPCYPSVTITLTNPTNAVLGSTPFTNVFYS
jgi:streptogramin lyase